MTHINHFLLGAALIGASAAASATTVYTADFQTSIGAEWSTNFGGGLALDQAPADASRRFLGQNDGAPNLGFSNDVVKLSLGALGAHNKVSVSFDVYLINSWDGNGAPARSAMAAAAPTCSASRSPMSHQVPRLAC